MIVVRPVNTSDIQQLYQLAKKVAPGITTFPPDMDVLKQKIKSSVEGFSEISSNEHSSSYLMVLEDTKTQKILGTSAVYSNIGQEIPFYTFKILSRSKQSYDINTKVESKSLHLTNEYTGDTEIGTLVLDPEYRGGGYGKLLAKCRYMLIAQFRKRFSQRVFAELRGWSDQDSTSPFWESVGKHFFAGMSYEKADYLSATTNNQFIADLMPDYPVYLNLLSSSAQSVVGKPHISGEPALKMLFNEGFRYEDYVDIFDAGPTVHAQIDDVVTVKNSRVFKISSIQKSISVEQEIDCLICNNSLENFRVCQTKINYSDDGVIISKQLSKALDSNLNDEVRIFSF